MVAFLALAAYANSLGNGFAYDDVPIVAENPLVSEGRVGELLRAPYWPGAAAGTGLYRPVTMASYAVEWELSGGRPFWFHLVNVLAHLGVSLLVLALATRFLPVLPAAAGAAAFAVHPVHVEAVANVVGRAELYATVFYLAACWLYLRGREWGEVGRALRAPALAVLYLLSLGSKEIGVTLPGMLLLLELHRSGGWKAAVGAVRRELPAYVLLGVGLGVYLWLRASVLGGVLGEIEAGPLAGLGVGGRLLTSVSLWGEYLRLLAFPADLSADYGPAVFLPSRGLNGQVVLGALVLLSAGVAVAGTWRRERSVALGILWFVLAVLPVSHLFFPTGTVLAERTLYLPSVGMVFVVGGVVRLVREAEGDARLRRAVGAVALVAGVALFVKTVSRNPTWLDTRTVVNTLAAEHPESFRVFWSRARDLQRLGRLDEAERHMEAAVELAPRHPRLLLDMGRLQRERGELDGAERHMRRAIRLLPTDESAHLELATTHLAQERPREAIRAAMAGIERLGSRARLWGVVSEAHLARGDLDAALRARRAALSADSGSRESWARLADLLERAGRPGAAREARARAADPSRRDRRRTPRR